MLTVNRDPVNVVAGEQVHATPFLRTVLEKVSLRDIRNAPTYTRCQLAYTDGVHERTTHGHAIGVSHDLFLAGLQTANRKEAAALRRTLELLSVRTADNLGPVLLCNLTTMGAVRTGIDALLRDAPGNRMLTGYLKSLDKAIIKVGVKTGKCKKAQPDAVLVCSGTNKICNAVRQAEGVMLECGAEVGVQRLLGGIAQAILPEAMANSIGARSPHLLPRFQQAEAVPELGEILDREGARIVDQRLSIHAESGGAHHLAGAIFNLLKVPECVLRIPPE